MGKTGFWKSDQFFGILVSLVLLVAGSGELLQSMERKAYDLGVAATSRAPSDKVAVIAIDKTSIDNIGGWPWSREIMAEMVEKLTAAQAKVIATTVFYSEPQRDAGQDYIDRLMVLCGMSATAAAPASAADAALPAAVGGDAAVSPARPEGSTPGAPTFALPAVCPQIEPVLREAEEKLNTDRRLAAAISQAGNVVLPMLGRYAIEKELGKGAMGVLYMGRDPKINRVVAIKTMAVPWEFDGDSMAQLMFKIANEAHPDIRGIRPGLPESLAAVIDKALAKDLNQRYQTGAGLVRDLRVCLAMIAGAGAEGSSGLGITI